MGNSMRVMPQSKNSIKIAIDKLHNGTLPLKMAKLSYIIFL